MQQNLRIKGDVRERPAFCSIVVLANLISDGVNGRDLMENRLMTVASIPIFSEFQRGAGPRGRIRFRYRRRRMLNSRSGRSTAIRFHIEVGNFWLTVPSRISGETGQNERNGSLGKMASRQKGRKRGGIERVSQLSESACIFGG